MKLIYLIVFLKCAETAKILAIVFSPSYSHQVAFRPIWKELSKRGHDITLLTTDPMNDSKYKNIREIDLSKSYEIMEKYGASDVITKTQNTVKSMKETAIQSDKIFISKYFFRFNVPFIGLTSLDAVPRTHKAIGNIMHPSIYPDFSLPFVRNLTFSQRLMSIFFSWAVLIYEYFLYQVENENAMRHFGDIRPLNEIEKDISMLFINVNPLFHHIRPIGPNTIPIGGGLHIQKVQPLPKELQDFMDNAEQGIIYFSLGTNVKSSLINDRLKSVILETFSDLPYKILWKFEEDNLTGKPKNVKIFKWIPQRDLIQHPKLVLFITQCGLQSMEESIYSHVPMVGMPFFGDQYNNARIMEEKRIGISVDHHNLSKEIFRNAILEVIKNPFYRDQVKDIATLSKDVEMTGLEKAVWWTEYTIRTRGAKHLKNPVVDLPYYKYYLLDVIGFILSITAVFLFAITKILQFLTELIGSRQ
ncbi:hypothetical protein NQ314_016376, partial [Rhamnusium bicolor]